MLVDKETAEVVGHGFFPTATNHSEDKLFVIEADDSFREVLAQPGVKRWDKRKKGVVAEPQEEAPPLPVPEHAPVTREEFEQLKEELRRLRHVEGGKTHANS